MASEARITVEVVAGYRERQRLIELQVPPGSTVRQAIDASGILRYLPELEDDALSVGIWGVVVPPDRILRDGERVELYRPLRIEPREARRRLAAVGRTMRDGPRE